MARGETGELVRLCRPTERGHEGRAAEGEACARTCGAPGRHEGWTARVRVGRSPRHANRQAAGLDTRLRHAETALAALTPPRGRGQRQSPDEATRVEAIALVRTAPRVEGLRSGAWDKQVERQTRYLGRGRGSASRPQQVIEPTRAPIPRIARQADHLTGLRPRDGWKAFGTKARPPRRSLEEAVWCDRPASRVARVFNRLQGRLPSAPLFVTRNDHIEGLTDLRTLGVRVFTVTACVLRRSLEQEQATLPGVHPEHKRKMTETPTAERLLQACAGVSLPLIPSAAGEDLLRRMTPLSGVQETILHRLGLGTHLSRQLAMQNMGG